VLIVGVRVVSNHRRQSVAKAVAVIAPTSEVAAEVALVVVAAAAAEVAAVVEVVVAEVVEAAGGKGRPVFQERVY
jgi:hypothetical protein